MKVLNIQKELLADFIADASMVCVKTVEKDRLLIIKPNHAQGFVFKIDELRIQTRGAQNGFSFDIEKYETYLFHPELEIKPTGIYKAYDKGLVQEFVSNLDSRCTYIQTGYLKHFEGAQLYTKEGDPIIVVAETTPGGTLELVGVVMPVKMK